MSIIIKRKGLYYLCEMEKNLNSVENLGEFGLIEKLTKNIEISLSTNGFWRKNQEQIAQQILKEIFI